MNDAPKETMEAKETTTDEGMEALILGRLARIVEEDDSVAYGVLSERDAICTPYIVVEERSKWWILLVRPFFTRYSIFEGPPFETQDEAIKLLESALGRGAELKFPRFTLIKRFKDPENLVLTADRASETFSLLRRP